LKTVIQVTPNEGHFLFKKPLWGENSSMMHGNVKLPFLLLYTTDIMSHDDSASLFERF
jgi:hypothetical protein